MASERARRALIGLALAATVVAVWQLQPAEAPAPPRSGPAPAARGKPGPAPLAEVTPERLRRPEFGAAQGDAFAARSWRPPAPPAKPAPAAPPSAPALPFTYLGKLIDGNTTLVFLTRGGANLVARPGDTLGDAYRVEAVTAERVEFLYLPLNQKQSLSLGRAN